MVSGANYRVYRLVSGFCGFRSASVVSLSRSKAVEAFCRLHGLCPSQVIILFEYPVAAL